MRVISLLLPSIRLNRSLVLLLLLGSAMTISLWLLLLLLRLLLRWPIKSRVGRDTSPSYRAAVCRLRGAASS